MAFDGYPKLQASIASWLKRSNLSSNIPDFVSLAEAKFNRILKVRQMRVSNILVPTTPYVDLPSDYTRMSRVEYGRVKLDYIPESSARRTIKSTTNPPYSYANANDMQNGYTIIGGVLWLCTYIDGATPLHMDYFASLEPLSASNPSNWLLQDAPDIYLFGALCEAEPFLKNDSRVTLWESKLQRAIDELESNDESGQFGDGPLEMKSA